MTGDASLAIIFPMDLINHAPVAQLDRVTGFEPVGREFESLGRAISSQVEANVEF